MAFQSFLVFLTTLALVPDSLHELEKLTELLICDELAGPKYTTSSWFQAHTTHLIQLRLIQFLSSPVIALQLLRVKLPLSQESDLPLKR